MHVKYGMYTIDLEQSRYVGFKKLPLPGLGGFVVGGSIGSFVVVVGGCVVVPVTRGQIINYNNKSKYLINN